MRFHALLPVRDEEDIIRQSLAQVLTWADSVYVFDTGSADQTWEIVQDVATLDKRVIPLKKDAVFYSETRLRGWMFHQARQQMREGDWFVRVDADEFHHIPPPDFVKHRMRKHETVAYHQYYDFQLTQSEARKLETNNQIVEERNLPIEVRRRCFVPSRYTEPRLCRYREAMQWPPSVSFPFNAGFIARARIPIRHYPHRDPFQLQLRCRLRAVMMADEQNRSHWSQPELHHWTESEWKKLIVPDDLAVLQVWQPGTDLPEPHFTNHLASPHIRVIQRLAHDFFLPMLDKTRRRYPPDAYPQKIPSGLLNRLNQELQQLRNSQCLPH